MSGRNLPHYAASFVGRESELDEIAGLLADPTCRLLTLVGPGGIGKTRLAIEAATRQGAHFANGSHFVPLQPLESPEQIIPAVMTALGLRESTDNPRESLLSYLTGKRLLLVMDNFEHLREDVDLLTDILNTAPDSKILVTSRESLRLQEEWLWQVRGLDYPDNIATSVNGDDSAVRLFVERAQRLRGELDFDAQYEHIVRICQLVEGMPLALELAAGWVKTLACREIADEIAHNLALLTARAQNIPERHRSMQTVFDHSWGLLTEAEQQALRRFAVFRGGCTREAAAQVAGATLDDLASLVEKSLLRHHPQHGRYDMHELMRQYADSQLQAANDVTAVRDCHAAYYGAHFHARENERQGPRQIAYWDALGADLDNIRAAWAWALERENYEVIYQLTEPVWSYFFFRSRTFEARTMYAVAHRQLERHTDQREQAILGRVLSRMGGCDLVYYHFDEGEAALRQCMAIAQAQHDLDTYYYAYRLLGRAVRHRDGHAQIEFVRQAAENCVAYYRECGDHFYLAHALEELACAYECLNQLGQSHQLFLDSLQVRRANGDLYGVAAINCQLGMAAMIDGRWDEADRYLTEGLDGQRESGSIGGIMMALACLSQVAVATGDFQRARQHAQDTLSRLEKGGIMFQQHGPMLASYLCLGVIAVAQGNDAEAHQMADFMFANAEVDGEGYMDATFLRGWVLCSQGQFAAAAGDLCEALSDAMKRHVTSDMLCNIAGFALILAHRGKLTRAAELLGLVFSRPESPVGYLKKHQGITQLRADLEAKLGVDTWADAWERGSQLDVEQVAAELLREFSESEDDSVTQANQALPDPLTLRELEVLDLLAEGLTNPQIGERLFVTTGAVKRYTSNIYGKLGVENRVQATTQAREIGLI